MIETYALCLFLAGLPIEAFAVMGVAVLKITGGLAFVVWLIGRLRPHDPIRWDLGTTLISLFVVWGALSVFWSIDSARSIQKLPTYVLLFVVYFLIVTVVRTERQLSAAMTALWLGTLVLLASGAVEAAGIQRGRSERLTGILTNPNAYVMMLMACIPSGYWFLTRKRSLARRLVALLAAVIAGITSIYAQSRGGIVSIGVFFLSLLAFRQTRRRGLVLAVLFVAIGLRLAPLTFWQRWEETREKGGDVRTLKLWPAGLAAFKQNPLLGSGLGTNSQSISLFLPPRRSGKPAVGVVHNAPLAIAIELGIPGLALYLGFTAYATVRLLRALAAATRQGKSRDAGFAIILLASFAGYMASWFKAGAAEYMKILWVLLGLMSVYSRLLQAPVNSLAGKDASSRLETI